MVVFGDLDVEASGQTPGGRGGGTFLVLRAKAIISSEALGPCEGQPFLSPLKDT